MRIPSITRIASVFGAVVLLSTGSLLTAMTAHADEPEFQCTDVQSIPQDDDTYSVNAFTCSGPRTYEGPGKIENVDDGYEETWTCPSIIAKNNPDVGGDGAAMVEATGCKSSKDSE
ncbi:hypothetical protein [Kitasatospora purpeofusca]|uniref:hypothetical protein n=1 Tax=Kitasatospora purpeofusca TaxID=67352 RepID=UPI003679E7D3